jgi:hypothetical protein
MARTLEMIFDAKLRNASDVEKFEATIDNVAKNTNVSTGNLRAFNQVLTETAQRTGSYSTALSELAQKSSIFQQFAKDIRSYVTEQDKAAEATQRWGRMMETAYQQNAARDKKAADDFVKAREKEQKAAQDAADKIIAAQTRVQNALGRVGVRLGGTALGSAAGLPGLGRVSGTVLSNLGLSGGTMAAIGGAAAGIFAGVEFAKSLDNLAKWAQEQKNAAAETGVTVSEMQELSRMSERTGVSLTGAAKSVQDLSKEMVAGGGRAREIQSALSELSLKSSVAFEEPYQALTDIQKGLAGIKDPVERDRVAIELLGESAGRAAAATAGMAKSGNIISDASMQTLVHARETMEQIGEHWDVLKSKFATPLNAVLNVIEKTADSVQNGTWWNNPSGGKSIQVGKTAAGWTFWNSPTNGSPIDLGNMGVRGPGLPNNPVGPFQFDLARSGADDKDARNRDWQALSASAGTPEDKYRGIDSQIETDEKNLHDRWQDGQIPYAQMAAERAQIEARKAAAASARKSAEEYRTQVESFQREVIAPVDASDTVRQLGELPKRYDLLGGYGPYQDWMRQLGAHAPGAMQQIGGDMLNRQFPGLATGDYSKLYSPMGKDNEDFQHRLEQQDRDARASQEELRRQSQIRIEAIATRQRDTTEDNEAALRLQTAQMSGQRTMFARQNQLSSTGVAQLSLDDQMKLIVASYIAKSGPITAGMGALAQVSAVDEKQQGEIDRATANDRAQLQKLQNDALTQSVEAVDKFNESIEEASQKLRTEFGGFAEGLFSAGLKGHAGTYARNFMIGQGTKAVGNLAQYAYQPGMLSIPGQGTPEDPTFIGRMLQGTMFAQDPKAQGSIATTDNTSATIDNTKATLALCSALGVDPNSVGVSGASSIATPSISSFGGAASGGILEQVQGIAKGLGISLPGISLAGANSRKASTSLSASNPSIAAILKLFGLGSDQSSAVAAYLTDSGTVGGSNSDFPDAFSFGSDSSDNSAFSPANPFTSLSTSDYNNMGANSQASNAFTDSVSDSIGQAFSTGTVTDSVGSAFAKAVAGETTSTTGGLTSAQSRTVSAALSGGAKGAGGNQTALGMGFQAAGGAFGMYQGITEMTHGGAQNISGGLGSSLMGASSILAMIPGAQVAAPFVAAAGAVASLVSAFMGDPRANRAKQLTEQEIANTYTAPNPLNVTTNANGMMTTTDYRGKVESLDVMPTVSKVNAILGFNPYNTSQLISSSQWQLSPSGMVPPSSKTTPASAPVQVNQSFSAFDAKSILDRSDDIASALSVALNGTHRVASDIQRVTGTAAR